jgi:hypothetical protein
MMKTNKAQRLSGLLPVFLLASGCTHVIVTEPGGERVSRSSVEFREYVAGVFRLQNQVMDQLITDYDLDLAADEDLERDRAEQRMVESCRDINEAAVAVSEGRRVSFSAKRQLVKTISSCDYAARDLHTLLNPGNDKLAESY